MKKYNHAYTLAFSVNTDRHPEVPVDPAEIMEAIALRLVDITTNKEWDEALGQPYDSYENQEMDSGELADQQRQLEKFSPPVEMLFRNYYRHCGKEWDDEWDSTCNDRCPECNAEIEPYESEDIGNGSLLEPNESGSASVGETAPSR